MAEPTFDCREILISSAALSGLEWAGPGDPRPSPETRSCRVSDTCKHTRIHTGTCMQASMYTHTQWRTHARAHTHLYTHTNAMKCALSDDCKVREREDKRRSPQEWLVRRVMAENWQVLVSFFLILVEFLWKQWAGEPLDSQKDGVSQVKTIYIEKNKTRKQVEMRPSHTKQQKTILYRIYVNYKCRLKTQTWDSVWQQIKDRETCLYLSGFIFAAIMAALYRWRAANKLIKIKYPARELEAQWIMCISSCVFCIFFLDTDRNCVFLKSFCNDAINCNSTGVHLWRNTLYILLIGEKKNPSEHLYWNSFKDALLFKFHSHTILNRKLRQIELHNK